MGPVELARVRWSIAAGAIALGFISALLWLSGPAAAPAGAQTATCVDSSTIEISAHLPQGHVGQSYSGQILLSYVTPPVTYSVVSGSLPPGLSMTKMGTGGGSIKGTPLVSGNSTFRVRVVDSSDPPACNTSGDLTISVDVDTSQVQSIPGQLSSLTDYLGRATPACILSTLGAALGQGPPGACN
jgi:hypothetical protein